jgi:hypothetical protein
VTGFAGFDTDSSKQVTVTLSRLLPPINTSSSTSIQEYIGAISTKDSGGGTIDQYTNTAADDIAVAPATAASIPTIYGQKLYPDFFDADFVDYYLKFSLAHSIPIDGVIEIKTPGSPILPGTNIQNSCWVVGNKYTKCENKNNLITLTLGERYSAGTQLELWIDNALAIANDAS